MPKDFSLDVCLDNHSEVCRTDGYDNGLTYATAGEFGERGYAFVRLAVFSYV